ncbi:hypothetical protein BT63DRAFT_453139 [Microthyrium microscopicum]|uniref:F-box domain-containing protein n=1 Tax=Microthyrium microscopicum TaxID=703497 RepID=A0A6A6UH59_9PEZI|nr:hypothetical protein BT63DRAFT_453139 [Microthyrium microscopicum]
MSFQALPSELIVHILEESRPNGFESLVLTCRRFHQVVVDNPTILQSHNKCRKENTHLHVTNKLPRSMVSTYIFGALNKLAELNSYLQQYAKVLELTPSDRYWDDIHMNGGRDRSWPPTELKRGNLFKSGVRTLVDTDLEHEDFIIFCNSDARRTIWSEQIERLCTTWPFFLEVLSEWDSCGSGPKDYADMAMVLLLQSLPNLQQLILHDPNGEFILALCGILCPTAIEDTPDDHARFPKSLKTLSIKPNPLGAYPMKLVAPILSFVPIQEFRATKINDQWCHDTFPAMSWTEFEWLTPDPLPSISTIVINSLNAHDDTLTTFLSRMIALKKLWLGFGHWDHSAKNQEHLISNLAYSVGDTLEDLVLTYRYPGSDYFRSGEKLLKQVIDFKRFQKLERLGLQAEFWEIGRKKGHTRHCGSYMTDFSINEAGEYDFLPASLEALYLFKKELIETSCNDALYAIDQTVSVATSLRKVCLIAGKAQCLVEIADMRNKLVYKGVDVLSEEYDFPQEYVDFFRAEVKFT